MFNLVHGDCLEKMIDIPDGSIDFIFADLPYGTTKNHWDRPIPLNEYVVVNGKELTQEQYLLYAYSAGIPYQNAINSWEQKTVSNKRIYSPKVKFLKHRQMATASYNQHWRDFK